MLNERVQNLRKSLPKDFEAALIQTEPNRFYFLDFNSDDAGHLLVLPDEMVYIIDSRYYELAEKNVQNAQVILEKDALGQVAELLQKENVKTLMLETNITLADYDRIKNKVQNVNFDTGSTLSKAIESLRAIKKPEEIARMKQAQKITDDCFTHILSFIKEGMREVDIMLEMEYFMRSHGAEKVAFDTICLTGTKTSLPHGKPGSNRVKAGDFITMDFGAKVQGYCTDMTRTIAFGKPSNEQKKVYDTVLRAHLAGIEAAKAGLKGNEVDKAARDILTDAGYGSYFGHGLGHAVGIEIHENPRFSPLCKDSILAGMMMTVEPGCYLPGQFGCRIEDTVLITETGCEPLPASDKNLIIL